LINDRINCIVERCPQCCAGMSVMKDAEGRAWYVCERCGAQIPANSGYKDINKVDNTDLE